jgi:NADP-dependent 3-hydroxy acid dehydrogenase YdfG
MNSLENKRILITGATSGIGKALTTKLLQKGAKVSFCGRSETKLKEQIAEY